MHPQSMFEAKNKSIKVFSAENCNFYSQNMSRVMRKPANCICKNKDADQLRGNREADQRLSLHG